MTRYLLATASVHTTASAADYLGPRVGDDDDEVVVVTVAEPDLPDRDAGDAANVARSRLVPATVEILERSGDPAESIRAVLDGRDVDVLLIGARRGDPDAGVDVEASLGSTALALLGTVDVPVVVVPIGP